MAMSPEMMMGGGMLFDLIGAGMAADASKEGALAQYNVERLNRQMMENILAVQRGLQEPMRQAGVGAIPDYQRAMRQELDVQNSPLYQMQAQMLADITADMPEYIGREMLGTLHAQELTMAPGRLMDLQKIGIGAAGAVSGNQADFGTMYGQSLQRGSGALAGGALQSGMQQQNAWMGALSGLSGLPAQRAAANYGQEQQALLYENSPQFVGPPSPY